MNAAYAEEDGKPVLAAPHHVNLGLAIDLQAKDGTRQLLVPNIKGAEEMDFRQFWTAYEDVIRKARSGKLDRRRLPGHHDLPDQPGHHRHRALGAAAHARPGRIVGVGAMEYPAAYQGASEETMARLAISKTVTLTSTYDHRIIQGAQSGDFLRTIHQLLLGEDDFYDDIFASLRIPYEPVRWVKDFPYGHEDDVTRSARVQELIHAYRVRGHLMADTNPLEIVQRRHAGPGHQPARPDAVGPGARVRHRRVRRQADDAAARDPRRAARLLLPDGRHRVHAHPGSRRAQVDPGAYRGAARPGPGHDEQIRILSRLNVAEAFETFLQTKFVGQRGSPSRAASR